MYILCKHFKATFKAWQNLFQDAADLASAIGREHVVFISRSPHAAEGVVIIWNWAAPETYHGCGYDLTGNESGMCPECGTLQSWEPPPKR